MSQLSSEFASAVQHHQAGRLPQAEQGYRQILAQNPNHAEAWHHLGIIACQVGKFEPAIECILKAITFHPDEAAFHRNISLCYRNLKRIVEAIHSSQRALKLRPDYQEAREDLASMLLELGQFAESEIQYRFLLERRPNDPKLQNTLGNVLISQQRLTEALDCYERAAQLDPNYPEAHNNLGNVLQDLGRFPEAITHYARALELRPNYPKAQVNLGIAYFDQGRLQDAHACLTYVLKEHPDFLDALNTLGNVNKELGNLTEACTCFRRLLQLDPDYIAAYNNLGNVLKDQGEITEAIACFRQAIERKPDYVEAHSNLVFSLLYAPGIPEKIIAKEHARWNERHAEPLRKKSPPHTNMPEPNRRLRIGYVSPDLYNHVVGRFLLPIFEHHDHSQFENICYASVRSPDDFTKRFQTHSDIWRPSLGVSDEQLAQKIRDDQIDILVDLSLHTAHHRLLVFARKPAPVQVTYLAYCGTSGMKAMDYRLTDPYLDPPGQTSDAVETPIYLPETYWCYRPVIDTPDVIIPPFRNPGDVTLGCLNNFCKVNDATLAVWARILQGLPQARLLLHAHPGRHRQRVYDLFAQLGIAADRVEFRSSVPIAEYFQLYQQIDIALDPFPYGGGTTTCDALWMGVPVISLAGPRAMGRGGLSILSNVGLSELVVNDDESYVRIATDLAQDPTRRQEWCTTLRERMRASPLMDAGGFARNLETAYRQMWQRWCEQVQASNRHVG